jgi:acetyl esterase/lipase
MIRVAMFVSAMLLTAQVSAQDRPATAVPAFPLPPSNQLSVQTRQVLARMDAARAPDLKGDVTASRAFYGKWNDDRLAEMRRHFATHETRSRLGGVPVDIVTPVAGVTPRNAGRVLINVHGGAFIWGAGSGALVEAVPIAATMGVKVVAVDYRLSPENAYPAASEDVTAVFRALLKTYRAENIGIYGCSAGGIITAQTVTWIRRHGLPRPGAIGTFCGTGAPYSGDSAYLSGPIEGRSPPPLPLPSTLPTAYMAGVPATDAAAYPLENAGELRTFPPTLMIAGGRDFAASALTLAHRRFASAGVPSQLFLFDGLPHAFFMWPDLPESAEVFAIVAGFFDRRLGTRPR